jgi:hypothetical protein
VSIKCKRNKDWMIIIIMVKHNKNERQMRNEKHNTAVQPTCKGRENLNSNKKEERNY